MSDTAAKLDILIDIKARLDELLKSQDAFRQAKSEAQSFGATLKAGLGIDLARRGLDLLKGAVVDSVREALRLAGTLKDVSQNLQIATEPLQVLTQLVKSNGGEMETLTQAIVHYRGVMASAREGNTEASATFRNLGLDLAALSRLPVERQLEQVARAITRADSTGSAFDNTVKLLGTRNAPKLTQSLRELAEQGYDKVAQSAKDAGQVMEEETIARLDRAQKIIAEFKRRGVIGVGSVLGFLADRLGIEIPKEKKGDDGSFAEAALEREKKRRDDVAETNAYIQSLQTEQQLAASDATLVESKRREKQVTLLREELIARQSLLALLEKNPDPKLDPIAAEAQLYALGQEIRAIENRVIELNGISVSGGRAPGGGAFGLQRRASAIDRIRDQAGDVNSQARNPNFLSAGEGVQAGVMQWATQLGSVGQQVASSLQSTIGTAVSSISDGIYGWISGTSKFGDAMLQLGDTVLKQVLQTLVQIGVQQVLNGQAATAIAIGWKALTTTLRAADTAETVAAESAKTPILATNAALASASSYGIAAVVGIAALALLIGAFIGGIAGRERGGPVEAGTPYVVGEKRPEVFVPNQSGTIVPSVDAYRVMQSRAAGGGAAALGAASAGGEPMGGKQRLLVVYTDHSATVEGLRRRPEFETMIVDINRRNLGEIGGA
ncbi:MAG: hypothetical protein JNK23_10680 [Opitutaceae bacterium]|nr:hypothetical protein [Opitutaceae bacterium]